MKRRIFLICLVAALLAMASAGTYAYYTQMAVATNVITTGGVDIVLHESTAEGKPYPSEPVTIMPGDVVSKIVAVENTGSHPAYLRIQLTPGINDSQLTAADCIQLDINEDAWTQSGDYYYYNIPLAPGSTTEPLFTQVTFLGEKVTNAYLGKLFSLDVAVFAVQSENNGASPMEAHGWPES